MSERNNGVLDSYHLGAALGSSAKKLGERCGPDAVRLLAMRLMESIGSPDDDRHSYIWRSAIEEHEQDSYKESFRDTLLDVLRDTTIGAVRTFPEETTEAVLWLLDSEFPTLVRIGIYTCAEHYAHLGAVFWTASRVEWFIEPDYWHEVFWLIKKNFPRFSASDRERYLQLIANFRGEWDDAGRQDEWDEEHRRDLLFPAVGLGDESVDAWFAELVSRRGAVREHADFHSYSTRGGWTGERSPVGADTLELMSDEELLALFDSFVPEPRSWDGPSYEGLAAAITAAVRASEDGFSRRLPLFSGVRRPYQHGVLRGVKERWSDDKRSVDWPGVVDLMDAIVRAPALHVDMAEKPLDNWEPSVYWVLSDIAGLLEAASEPDRQIELELLRKGLGILSSLLEVVGSDEPAETKDAVSHAINSSRGKLLEATIKVALAIRRQEVSDDVGGNVWDIVIPIFERELSVSEVGKNQDFATLAGMYCVNLHYLSPSWVEDNFDRIFSLRSEVAWRCAAQGFASQRYLYDWLFEKLKRGGHLRKMIFSHELSDAVPDKAIQFLALAYLERLEALDERSLLVEVINSLEVQSLSNLCWFFWTLRGRNEYSDLILTFWELVVDATLRDGREHPEIKAALNLLAPFIQELNPKLVDVWSAVAPYAQVRHHGNVLVENLERLANTHPLGVAKVFKSALNGFLPDYEKDDIVRCVTRIAEAGEFDEAEAICLAYADGQSTLLNETYQVLREMRRVQNLE